MGTTATGGAGGKKKSWSSDGSTMMTASGPKQVRSNRPWYKSSHREADRRHDTALRVVILPEAEWHGNKRDANYAAYVARKQRQLGLSR